MFVEHKEAVEITEATAKLDEASKLLLKGAAKLERDGWCQGQYRTGAARCMLGSIGYSDNGGANDTMLAAHRKLSGALGSFAHMWNDAAGRTKEEVIAKMRAVALGL